ncbi:MAG: response regulator [Desulfobacteraceae bacterium]|jgi:DNA-binding NtrC family response regulator|nr:MAG: response regulator [Desulfobacteraceae bacterium]
MEKKLTIVVADRNPHVRDFLRREMTSEGYLVRLAKSARELLELVYGQEPLDVAIVDPDLPDEEAAVLMSKLEDRLPPLPVVIHAFVTDENPYASVVNVVGVVEKRGNSIEKLKKIVSEILNAEAPMPARGAL